MGRIGRQIAKRAHGFGMTIQYHNRTRSDEAEVALKARYATKDELLATSDFIVLTVPLTAETRGLIGRAELAKMKPTATLVNVARGAIVDKDALAEALSSRKLHAAALDVTDPEPLPSDHPLLKLDNIIITPHLAARRKRPVARWPRSRSRTCSRAWKDANCHSGQVTETSLLGWRSSRGEK